MKLIEYNALNSMAVRKGKPTVGINRSSGVIRLSGAAANAIGLKAGDYIKILQDEENPNDFFICKTTAEVGFKLRSNSSSTGLMTNCVTVCVKMLESAKTDDKALFNLIPEPQKINKENMFLVITKLTSNKYVSKL